MTEFTDDDFGLVEDPKRICPENTTAVILCGGQGTRLRPYDGPKALLPIGGKPLVQRLIEHLQSEGIKKFHLCLGYKADEVYQTVRNCKVVEDCDLTISDAGLTATMVARLAAASVLVETPYLLVCYGDTLANVSVDQLCTKMAQAEAGMIVSTKSLTSEFGIARTKKRVIEGHSAEVLDLIDEKPTLDLQFNIGYILCQHWSTLNLDLRWSLVDWVNAVTKDDLTLIHRHEGAHFTVNTEQDLLAVNERFKKGVAHG